MNCIDLIWFFINLLVACVIGGVFGANFGVFAGVLAGVVSYVSFLRIVGFLLFLIERLLRQRNANRPKE